MRQIWGCIEVEWMVRSEPGAGVVGGPGASRGERGALSPISWWPRNKTYDPRSGLVSGPRSAGWAWVPCKWTTVTALCRRLRLTTTTTGTPSVHTLAPPLHLLIHRLAVLPHILSFSCCCSLFCSVSTSCLVLCVGLYFLFWIETTVFCWRMLVITFGSTHLFWNYI